MLSRQLKPVWPLPDPSRRQWLHWSLGAGALLAGAHSAARASLAPALPATLHWRERHLQALGTHLHLQAGHRQAKMADAGLDAAVAAILQVQRTMSLFDADSQVSRLNRDGELHQPHPDLVKVLQLSAQVSAKSKGAFDVTVQPYWAVWQTAQKSAQLPTPAQVDQAKSLVGWQKLKVSADKISFKQAGMSITLNGIAQGFAGDQARAALCQHGVEHALLDTGEYAMLGNSPQGGPWQLGVANPRGYSGELPGGKPRQNSNAARAQSGGPPPFGDVKLIARLKTDGRAVATSSDADYRFGDSDLHHHIFNPKTGYSPRQLASVTVLASRCALADALTKVMFMGGLDDALQLARLWQVDVLAVAKNGRWVASNKIFSSEEI